MGNLFSTTKTTKVQLCDPYKTRQCARAGKELTCDEFHLCRAKHGQVPCTDDPWFKKCGWSTSPVSDAPLIVQNPVTQSITTAPTGNTATVVITPPVIPTVNTTTPVPTVQTPTVPAVPAQVVVVDQEAQDYNVLAEALVNRHSDYEDIARTWFFVQASSPEEKDEKQMDILEDAREFALNNRAGSIALGKQLGFLKVATPGEKRDVSQGMAQWLKNMAEAQTGFPIDAVVQTGIVGAFIHRSSNSKETMFVLLGLLLVVGAGAGTWYLLSKNNKKKRE